MGKVFKCVVMMLVVATFIYSCARAPIEKFADTKAALEAARRAGAEACAKKEFREAEKAYKEAEELLKTANVCSPNPIAKSVAESAESVKDVSKEEKDCIPQDELYRKVESKLVYAQGKANEAKNIALNASRKCNTIKSRLSEINDEILTIKKDLIEAGKVNDLDMLMDRYNEVEGYLQECSCDEAQTAMSELVSMLNRTKEALAAGTAVVKAEKPEKVMATAEAREYKVKKGDCLWRISEKEYLNPFMWPLIYWANKAKIKDPDLIYPGQIFKIEEDYTSSEKDRAIRKAKTRGPWSLFDGK
ncbi:MAG: LysM peptidoglycan-binding domain-containing protein [Deferribacterota bacterium]|nr:LysM peptidoglycan-binding domain-containing protein [Deferribacterota bacterium]